MNQIHVGSAIADRIARETQAEDEPQIGSGSAGEEVKDGNRKNLSHG